jgi:hypothetical protein
MSLHPATVNLTLDNANCDGRITTQGFGLDWPAHDGHQAGDPLLGQSAWQYDAAVQYIPPLNAIAPAGYCTRTSQVIGAYAWVPRQGLWELSPTSGYLKTRWLHYYDGRGNRVAANAHGVIRSMQTFAPNLGLWIWRFAGSSVDTDPPLVALHFLGDLSGGPEYMVMFPGASATQSRINGNTRAWSCPMLLGREFSGAPWVILDECRRQSGRSHDAGGRPEPSFVSIEYLDGCFLCNLGGETWSYRGAWTAASGREIDFVLPTGVLELEVCGHPAMLAVNAITYPAKATVRPVVPVRVPGGWQTAPLYRALAATEPGTTAVVVAQDGLLPFGESRPIVELQTTDSHRRAGLYAVQEYRVAEIGDVSSNPVETDGNPNLGVLEISGSLNDRWRGASLTATLEPEGADYALDIIKSNVKLSAEVSLAPAGSGDGPALMFTGYVLPQEPERSSEFPGHVTAKLQAADWIEARGSGHFMLYHPSYEHWPIKDAFEYILQRAGVAATNISVSAAITAASHLLPRSPDPGRRSFDFRPDQTVVSALDAMVAAVDCEWGVDQNGICFLRPRWTRAAGYFDYELTDDELEPEDILPRFSATGSIQDFINCLAVIVISGGRQSGQLLLDSASMADPAAANFIGEDRWAVETLRDPALLHAVAQTLWQQRHRLSRTVYWDLISHPEWLPDHYIKVSVAGCDVPEGTICKITRKSWSVDRDGQFRQGFDAVVVEEVAPGSGS